VLSSWYFTDRTCLRIEQLWSWSAQRIAFLGTPRLYEWFARANLGRSRVLVDLDPLVVAMLKAEFGDAIIGHDIREPPPIQLRTGFTCVICDPPWYPADIFLWIDRATELAPDGLLCISLFPPLTRPSAARERNEILSILQRDYGAVTLLSDFLEYQIPSFEYFQLAAIGLAELEPWKVADLILLRLRPGSGSTSNDSPIARTEWIEVDLGTLRVFVNPAKSSDARGALLSRPLGGSLLLPSPSRRERVLTEVNVLTSRGHGLTSADPFRLIKVLQSLAPAVENGNSPRDILDLDVDSASKEVLESVVHSTLVHEVADQRLTHLRRVPGLCH
jgi:hypothetical protein